ncbi:MAG: alanine/glycine:cation symporter family protein [Marinifilaceae bacterium]
MIEQIEAAIKAFSDFAWGAPLLILLIGGGLYFLVYSEFVPFKHIGHALKIIRGDYDEEDGAGDINHYEALSTAIAATVGLGNISGIAIAIAMGGPGAIFWMWVSAFLGVSTKFFTCSLSIMYRGKDSKGEIQGGPMYVIEQGLGKKWKPMAIFFSIVGMIGVSPIFQANQLTKIFTDVMIEDAGFTSSLVIGIIISIIVGIVIYGGIKRIGKVTGKLVPIMVILYVLAVLYIIISNYQNIPASFSLIFSDAFSGDAVLGGALGGVILIGAKRAAFSNEAGIGTAPMAHGAALTNEPIREGLVAMLGPIIDTILVCTMTALAIIITGVWNREDLNGVTMTLEAFNIGIPYVGKYILIVCVAIFSLTTLFAFPYYGAKCLGYVIGAERKHWYNYFFLVTIVLGAVSSLAVIVNLIDGMYAMMAFPTMISALLLSPKVKTEMKRYLARHKANK